MIESSSSEEGGRSASQWALCHLCISSADSSSFRFLLLLDSLLEDQQDSDGITSLETEGWVLGDSIWHHGYQDARNNLKTRHSSTSMYRAREGKKMQQEPEHPIEHVSLSLLPIWKASDIKSGLHPSYLGAGGKIMEWPKVSIIHVVPEGVVCREQSQTYWGLNNVADVRVWLASKAQTLEDEKMSQHVETKATPPTSTLAISCLLPIEKVRSWGERFNLSLLEPEKPSSLVHMYPPYSQFSTFCALRAIITYLLVAVLAH
ncbi:hypothetical protein L218DRAFT_1008929 [Marasmius fiardii PR-910]|nr:hypothetical protein L218DRAFT_1008929 [Marasmius fiardii PR-910]